MRLGSRDNQRRESRVRNGSSIRKSRAMEYKLEGDVGGLAAFFMLIDMI